MSDGKIEKIKRLMSDPGATDGERIAAGEALKRLERSPRLDQGDLRAFFVEVEFDGKTYKMPIYTLE